MKNYREIFDGWWFPNPPIDAEVKAKLLERMGNRLPPDYIEFLEWSNGGQGDTEIIYLTLWPAEDLLNPLDSYTVEDFLPGCIAFGDNGPRMLFFDLKNRVCSTPFGYSGTDCVDVLASSLDDFLDRIKLIEP